MWADKGVKNLGSNTKTFRLSQKYLYTLKHNI
jgi:hypothetical protein